MLMHCAQLRRTFSGMTAHALTLDSAKSVAFIEQHGECDLPTRRHAEESRPAPMQGRTMSLILPSSAEKLMRSGYAAAMARPEILVQPATLSPISARSERGQQILP